MVAQLRESVRRLSFLLPPDLPPADMMMRQGGLIGFKRATDGTFTVSPTGEMMGVAAQRIVLAYALRFETREQLAERWNLSVRHVQAIVAGDALHWFTAPVRRWLREHAIGDERLCRGLSRGRLEQINAAFRGVAAEAAAVLQAPGRKSQQTVDNARTNLWLLSGAWRENEP